MKYGFTLIALLFFLELQAQTSMDAGFVLLEKGAYSEAKTFFADRLSEDPNNLTAQICYGRALGIGEDAQAAQSWFSDMASEHPGNLEVLLNLYESYLWKEDYTNALPGYQALTRDYPDNFNAWLGYANTLSNLKAYEEALVAIKRALVLDPGNRSAKTSLKYIRLGYAYQFQLSKKFVEAFDQLDSLSLTHPGDEDLLRSRAYTLLAAGESAALQNHLDTLSYQWVPLVRASAFLQRNKATRAIPLYDNYLREYPANQEARMGLAHALNAADRKKEAYVTVNALLQEYPALLAAEQLKARLEKERVAVLTNEVAHHWDNGGNTGWQMNASMRIPIGSFVLLRPSYSELNALNASGEDNRLRTGSAIADFRLMPHTRLQAGVSMVQLQADDASYAYPLYTASMTTKPWAYASVSFGYKQQLEDFNAVLLEQRLRNSRYTLTFHQGSRKGWGVYTNLQDVSYSDGNHSSMAFTSLYKQFGQGKILKLGVNLQYLAFRESRPDLYFSPETYKAAELFCGYEGTLWDQLKIQAGLAGGLQQIETNDITPVGRINLVSSLQLAERFTLNLNASHSTISSGNSAGFKFSRVGLGLKWELAEKPLGAFAGRL